ncbi:MAG TPA: tRNA (guanosine(37)-N1)-methyltransferase TrmD [Alphaproteobacteria bacterium]|nr:tRNA (guanosine(37)-N1)-methyltransferase TrmD [Alphaproteobacteria bacterium]
MSWRAVVLTLFPEMFPGPLGSSLAGKALARGDWELDVADIRVFASDKHSTVDDTPFGGGAGMVMRPDVLDRALEAKADTRGPVIYLSPRGKPLDQSLVKSFAAEPSVTLLCGRYEGVDQRLIEARGLVEVSIGDFVLSGGEAAAITLLDACVRLLPGVLGDPASLAEESFESGLLEYPHYTRPAEWKGKDVPEVLLSGNHAAIAAWRRAEAERITQSRRPDLWARYAGRLRQAPAHHHEG